MKGKINVNVSIEMDKITKELSNLDNDKILALVKEIDLLKANYELTQKLFLYLAKKIIEMDDELEDGESLNMSTLNMIDKIKNKQFKR